MSHLRVGVLGLVVQLGEHAVELLEVVARAIHLRGGSKELRCLPSEVETQVTRLVSQITHLFVVEERDGVVELEEVVALHLNRLLVRTAAVLEVVQLAECDGQVHVRAGEVRFEVDGRAEEMKRRCELARVQMHLGASHAASQQQIQTISGRIV